MNGIIIEPDSDDWRAGGGLQLMDTALLDQQIATARRYPRGNIGPITEQISAMVTYSEEVAEECIYAVPRGGKTITGPSVRFAEAVASCWGNSDSGSRIVEVGDDFVTAQGAYRDLERNIRVSMEVKRPIVDSNGVRYKLDMIGVTSNAAMSIALRNAILKGVPKMAWGPAFVKAQAMIAGTFESLQKRRAAALAAFKKLGVEEDLVLQLINARSAADIEPEDMIVLRGTLQAIKDGDTTVRNVFGNATTHSAAQKADVGGKLDEGKKNGAKAAEAKQGGKANAAAGEDKGGASERSGDAGNGGGERDEAGGGAGTGDDAAGPAGGDQPAGGGSADGENTPAAATNAPDGSGAGDEGGLGVGATADASGASEDATPVPVADDFTPFLSGEELGENDRVKLTNAARAFTKASTSVQVAAVIAEFQPVFESSPDPVTSAFTKMAATANKLARKGAKNKL